MSPGCRLPKLLFWKAPLCWGGAFHLRARLSLPAVAGRRHTVCSYLSLIAASGLGSSCAAAVGRPRSAEPALHEPFRRVARDAQLAAGQRPQPARREALCRAASTLWGAWRGLAGAGAYESSRCGPPSKISKLAPLHGSERYLALRNYFSERETIMAPHQGGVVYASCCVDRLLACAARALPDRDGDNKNPPESPHQRCARKFCASQPASGCESRSRTAARLPRWTNLTLSQLGRTTAAVLHAIP